MTRRTAELRHQDTAPARTPGAESGAELLDVLIAFHHPTRRWLCEVLSSEGPAKVGTLAARTGLAVGSVSHHLKALHRYGFVEPAPDLARDTRESWWRIAPRDLSWLAEDFTAGTMGRRVARGRRAGELPAPGARRPAVDGRRPGTARGVAPGRQLHGHVRAGHRRADRRPRPPADGAGHRLVGRLPRGRRGAPRRRTAPGAGPGPGLPERTGGAVSATPAVDEPRLIGAEPPPVRDGPDGPGLGGRGDRLVVRRRDVDGGAGLDGGAHALAGGRRHRARPRDAAGRGAGAGRRRARRPLRHPPGDGHRPGRAGAGDAARRDRLDRRAARCGDPGLPGDRVRHHHRADPARPG